MSDTQVLAFEEPIPVGEGRVFDVAGRAIAVFNVDGQLFAIDDHCPHRGASLAEGRVRDGVVRCPWHKWEFDLTTGRCVGNPGNWVRRHEVSSEDGEIRIRLAEASAPGDGVYRYLVRFGAMGWIRRFGSIDPISLDRGDCVVVETDRGLEVGELLAVEGSSGPPGESLPQPTGELVRRASLADVETWNQTRLPADELLEAAQAVLDEHTQRLQIIDGERLFESTHVCLYVLGDLPADTDDWNARLSARLGVPVTLHATVEPAVPAQQGGCGSGGCGSGGCHS